MNRLKLRDAEVMLKNLTGVKRTRKTIYNWCKVGRKAHSGEMVILKHEVVMGECFTTEKDLREFLEELRR